MYEKMKKGHALIEQLVESDLRFAQSYPNIAEQLCIRAEAMVFGAGAILGQLDDKGVALNEALEKKWKEVWKPAFMNLIPQE